MVPINFHRVNAVIVRHMMSWPRSLERLADAFWWPTINITLFGLITMFLSQQSGSTKFYANIFLGGLMMWVVLSRSQEEMGVLFLQDAWDRNVLNLFASPLTITEFIIATIALATIKLILTFCWMGMLTYMLFAFNVFSYGWALLPYIAALLVSGWSLGLVINGLIFQFGYRIQVFAWTMAMLFQPFSGVYYPVSAMPAWMQVIAKLLPTSYIFEGMRSVLMTHRFDASGFLISTLLNVFYLVIGIVFFRYSYAKAKETGMIMKFS